MASTVSTSLQAVPTAAPSDRRERRDRSSGAGDLRAALLVGGLGALVAVGTTWAIVATQTLQMSF